MEHSIPVGGNENGFRRIAAFAEQEVWCGFVRHDCHFDSGNRSAGTSVREMKEQVSCRWRKVNVEFCLRMLFGKLDLRGTACTCYPRAEDRETRLFVFDVHRIPAERKLVETVDAGVVCLCPWKRHDKTGSQGLCIQCQLLRGRSIYRNDCSVDHSYVGGFALALRGNSRQCYGGGEKEDCSHNK